MHVVRLRPCASLLHRTTLWGKLRSALAAQTPGEASNKECFALHGCRKYASDAVYRRAFNAARDNPEAFWGEVGQDITWFQPWSKTLHVEDPVFPNW